MRCEEWMSEMVNKQKQKCNVYTEKECTLSVWQCLQQTLIFMYVSDKHDAGYFVQICKAKFKEEGVERERETSPQFDSEGI